MIVDEKINQVTSLLNAAQVEFGQGVEDAQQEACWMVLHALGDEALFDPDWQAQLTQEQVCQIDEWVRIRIDKRKPFAYIVNKTWFAGLPFYIDERALIPRSYVSEWVLDQFQPWVDAGKVSSILDLCCGSGCIGIACAYAWPEAKITLSDIDQAALEVAKKNVEQHQLGDRVSIHNGDMFAGIVGRFDMIVCNPPYVSLERMRNLPEEFLHEPEHALVSGDDGLNFTRKLLVQAVDYLNPQGVLIVEVGSASEFIERVYKNVPFTWLITEYDEMTVFVLTLEELLQFQEQFKQALN